jgi:FtsP/CotA-like multicopper oxidase with cupredoxin domain
MNWEMAQMAYKWRINELGQTIIQPTHLHSIPQATLTKAKESASHPTETVQTRQDELRAIRMAADKTHKI